MFEGGDASRIGPDLTSRVALVPADLDLPGYRLHPLKGALKGFWIISVSGNWRMILELAAGIIVRCVPGILQPCERCYELLYWR